MKLENGIEIGEKESTLSNEENTKNKSKKPKKKIVGFLFIAIVISIVSVVALTNTSQPYEILDTEEYIRDGEKCISYRVQISKDSTEKQLMSAYNNIIENDTYYLHTIFFYGQKSDVKKCGEYTVAKLEELEQGKRPEIEKPTLSNKH